MDSLMDAMTNVVGILLLILIVSSLGITAAVQKVVENLPEVSMEQLEAVKVSRDQTLQNLQDLIQTHTNTMANLPSEEEADALVAELEELELNNEELVEKTSDLAEWMRKVEEEETLKEVNEEKVRVADSRDRELAAILAQTPEPQVVTAKEVTMPDPRVADPEATALYLVCKFGKLFYIGDPYDHALRIRDVIDQNFADLAPAGNAIGSYTYVVRGTRRDGDSFEPLTERYRLGRRDRDSLAAWEGLVPKWTNRAGEAQRDQNVIDRIFGANEDATLNVSKFRYDRDKILAFFGEGKYGPADFAYHISAGGGDRIKMGLQPKEEAGWTPEEFLATNSQFEQYCRQASTSRRVLFYYYVAPDSFDTYLQARAKSEQFRIPAGWTIWDGDAVEPRAAPARATVRYNFDSLPKDAYRQLAETAGRFMVEELNKEFAEFDDRVKAAIPEDMTEESERAEFVSKLSAERRAWNVSNFQPWTLGVFQAALAATRVSGEKEITLEIHPPEIPGIRVFSASRPPQAPTPPRDPSAPRPPSAPTGPGRLILD